MMDAAALGGRGSARLWLTAAVLVVGVLLMLAWLAGMGNGAPPALGQTPVCVAPTVTDLDIHSRYVVVTLDIENADATPESYNVRFKRVGANTWTQRNYDVPADTVLEKKVTGFDGGKLYDIRFLVNCGINGVSTTVERQIMTATVCLAPTVTLTPDADTITVTSLVEFPDLEIERFQVRWKRASESTYTAGTFDGNNLAWRWIGRGPSDTRTFGRGHTQSVGLFEEEDYDVQVRSECTVSGNHIHSEPVTLRTRTIAINRHFGLTVEADGETTDELVEGGTVTATLTITSVEMGRNRLAFKRDHAFRLGIVPSGPTSRGSGPIQPGEILISNSQPTADDPNPSAGSGYVTLPAGEESVSWTLTAPTDTVDYDDADDDDEYQYEYFKLMLHGPEVRDAGWYQPQLTGFVILLDSKYFSEQAMDQTTINLIILAGNVLRAQKDEIRDVDGLQSPKGFTYQWLRNGVVIPGAISETYTHGAADINRNISARVLFTDAAGNSEVRTTNSLFIPSSHEITWPGKPTPPSAGQTLTADTSVMTFEELLPSPTFTYAWYHATDDGLSHTSDVLGTSSTYTLTNDDQGKKITVYVVYIQSTNDEPISVRPNSPTPNVGGTLLPDPNNPATGTVTISGTPEVTNTIEANLTDYEDLDGTRPELALSWQWLRNGQPISGAYSRTYEVVLADVGTRLSARVRFEDLLNNVETLTSAETAPIPVKVNHPATGDIAIQGTVEVAERLEATVTNVMDIEGIANASYTHQWLRGGNPIPGATGLGYTITLADMRFALQFRVSFMDDIGFQETLLSDTTAVVPVRLNNEATGDVTITGTAELRNRLTGAVANVVDAEDGVTGASYTYQWLRDGQPIAGETGLMYDITLADIGHTFQFRVEFTDDIGFEETLHSEETAAVPSGPVIVYPRGAFIDEEISVDTSTITFPDVPSPPDYEYRWIYVTSRGMKQANIPFARSDTHTLVAANDQRYIQVEVTYRSTETNSSVTRLANEQTPLIR